jgi:pyruvate dehydrogenase E2 component (dihydrolipoamide acetyltransferase)
VPDIGGADVTVIEILVAEGDQITADMPLITVEGDKATMEIPAPFAGVVKKIAVKVGDKIAEGSLVLELAQEGPAVTATEATKATEAPAAVESIQEVRIPDIGGASGVTVIEIAVKPGSQVNIDEPLLTLEGDKATMEVPSPLAGEVTELKVKVGDKVSEGDLILMIKGKGAPSTKPAPASAAKAGVPQQATTHIAHTPPSQMLSAPNAAGEYASPGVRRLVREFDLDIKQIKGTGIKGRITREDVQNHVKNRLRSGSGLSVLPAPQVDFAKFGEIETQPLSKIKKISGANLHRNWVTIPHVTQFDEADITALEEFRKQQKDSAAAKGIKLTPLVFIMKAVVAALRELPNFNSSLDASGEQLVLKKYFHIGVAVDTPNGLVVPVIRDVDKKSIYTLAQELAEISTKAREKGLSVAEMQGSCFTITSLGGIGGTAFTPIINAPDVAILGVSKSQMKPVYQADGQFQARLMLPLSLSYDHRVIDGADGARFIVHLAKCLNDIHSLVL